MEVGNLWVAVGLYTFSLNFRLALLSSPELILGMQCIAVSHRREKSDVTGVISPHVALILGEHAR